MNESGQNETKAGQKPPKPRQVMGLRNMGDVEYGTDAEQSKHPLGPSKTTTRPQPAHNRPITETDYSPDLQIIINDWPNLPMEVKTGILAMVKAIKN